MKDLTEEDFKKAEKDLKKKDSLFDIKVELGKLLLKDPFHFTELERERFIELKKIIDDSQKHL